MSKILISLECPAIAESWDVYVPDTLTAGQAAGLMGRALEELSEGCYVSSGHEFLCHRERDVLLKESEELRNYGLQNGEHLIIM